MKKELLKFFDMYDVGVIDYVSMAVIFIMILINIL